MIRGLLRLVLLVVLVVVVGAFLLGYDIGDFRGLSEPRPTGTSVTYGPPPWLPHVTTTSNS